VKKYMKIRTGKRGTMWKKLPSDYPAVYQIPVLDG
jgi:hypothetical protein